MTKFKFKGFPLALGIYALVFVVIAAIGLGWFWSYMDAYEQSRPHTAMDEYMEKLTATYICNASAELIASVDRNLQSEESCRQVILDALNGNFTYSKKASLCTNELQVYVVESGDHVIGTVEMTQTGESRGGFVRWQVIKESFDLSFLRTDPISITVPQDFSVSVFGNKLSEQYITQQNVPYAALAEFYNAHSLPHMVTYQAGPFLGQANFSVTDKNGNAVTIDDSTDLSVYMDNCTTEEISALNTICKDFVQSYVDFTSRTGGDNTVNYNRLKQYLVPNGELAKRMHDALDGLYWVTDRGATLSQLDINHYVRTGEGKFICDLTYVVDTRDFNGNIQSTSNIKIIVTETAGGLKVEYMLSY